MTAPNLKGNFSKFGAYYAYKLRSLRTLTILNCIFALFSYPAVMLVFLPFLNADIKVDELRELPDYFNNAVYIDAIKQRDAWESLLSFTACVGVLMLAAMFIMNYVIPNKSFRWLYKKSAVDMDYSLPVSDDTRFFGDLLASMTSSFAPHLAAIAIGSSLFWMMPFERDGIESVLVGEMFRVAIQLAFTGVVACVMLMGITLLVMSLCGRVVEARIMPLVVNIVIPAIHAICVIHMIRGMRNYGYNSSYEYMGIAATSPLGLLLMTLMTLVSGTSEYDVIVAMTRPGIAVPLTLVIVGCFACAYFLIRYRRAERVGVPFVFPAVKTVLMGAVTFMIISLFTMLSLSDDGDLFANSSVELVGPFAAMIVITFIVYVIMELISGKGFAKFHRTLLRYALTAVISIALCIGIYCTHGMGFERVVPQADEVTGLRVTIVDYDDSPTAEHRNEVEFWNAEVVLPEEIENVIRIHDSLNRQLPDEGTAYRFEVEYSLRNGSILHREFYLDEQEFTEKVKSVVTPELYYRESYGNLLDWYSDGQGGIVPNAFVRLAATESGVEVVDTPLADLMEALHEDCQRVNYDLLADKNQSRLDLCLQIYYLQESGEISDNQMYITLWSWQKNAIALLEECGAGGILFESDSNRAMVLKVMADDLYEDGIMSAESMCLGNIDVIDRTDRPDIYRGDYSCVMSGSGETVPGNTFEMIEVREYIHEWMRLAENTEPEKNYSSELLYMLVEVDEDELSGDTVTVNLDDSILYVPDISAESVDWLFGEMMN